MSTVYNKEMPVNVLETLKTYFEMPSKEFTYLDWNYRGEQLPYRLFKTALNKIKMYTASEIAYSPARSDFLKDASVKHYLAKYTDDVKISRGVFSFGVVDLQVTSQLSNIIDDIDRFLMPDFTKMVDDRLITAENRRLDLLGLSADKDFTMEDFENNTELDSKQLKAIEKAINETKEEKETRMTKMRKNIEKDMIRTWRKNQKEIQKDIRYYRTDHIILHKTTEYLREGGILMMMVPIPMIDEDLAFKLANYYDDLKILLIEDKVDFADYQKAVIIGKKRAKIKDNRPLANVISYVREITHERLRTKSGYSMDDEAVKADIAADPDRYMYYEKEIAIDNLFEIMERQETPRYKIPDGFAESVSMFRVGPLTDNEILDVLASSRLLTNLEKKCGDMFLEKQNVTPTPLHDGHIVMLLTSGLLNGYIGTGPNQHLVKGTAVKTVNEVEEFDEDGDTKIVKKEYYNIAVTTLNSDGKFQKIM